MPKVEMVFRGCGGGGGIRTDVQGELTAPGGRSRDSKSPNQAHHGTDSGDKGEKLAWN